MSKLPGELRPGKAAGTSCPTSHGPRGAVGRASSPLRELVGHGEERVFFRNFRILLLQKFFSQNLLSKKFYVCRQNFFKKKFNKRFYKFSFSEIFFILLTLS